MSAGAVISHAWGLYRAHFRHLISISLIVYALVALFTLVLVLLLGELGGFIAAFVTLAGVYWLQGALVIAIDDIRDGKADLSVRETLERVRPRMNTLSVAALLITVALVVSAFIIFIGFILFIVPGLLLLVGFLFLLVRWLLIVPVIMLERRGVIAALDRSSDLVKGHGWSVLGVIAVTVVILIGVAIAISLALSPLDNDIQAPIGNLISSTLTAPFVALAWTLTYFAVRDPKQVDPAPVAAV